LSTLFPLHAGRLPPTAVLLSHKQFADQLFSGAQRPGKQRTWGMLRGNLKCIEVEKPAVLCRLAAKDQKIAACRSSYI
jgi:hypothetical protein